MTADDMRAMRKRLGMTQAQLANALGLVTSSIANYEGARGKYAIPRVIELACQALLSRTESLDFQSGGQQEERARCAAIARGLGDTWNHDGKRCAEIIAQTIEHGGP